MNSVPLPVLVPFTRLEADTLQCLLEDFATRDGTDYGEVEMSLVTRVQLLHEQLKSGDARLVYFPVDESIQLLSQREAKAMGLED